VTRMLTQLLFGLTANLHDLRWRDNQRLWNTRNKA
jgi:hypothetical protein